jgi:aspartate/methionine/tyrosine aminotransferase
MNHPLSIRINQDISPSILGLLSTFGRGAYFPTSGILGQSGEAKGCAINATIGIALEEDGRPMCLSAVAAQSNLPGHEIVPYAPSYGLPALRTHWKTRLVSANPDLESKPTSEPVVTCALTHALSVVGQLLLEPGGTLVLPDLFWGNYRLIFERGCDAEIKTFKTFKGDGFNVAGCLALIESLPPGPITLLLNFPNNPTGYACTPAEGMALKDGLAALASERNGLSVIVDDAYFGLNYDSGSFQQSIFALLVDAHESLLAIKVDGATKEDFVWGFRVGFITLGYRNANRSALAALEDKCAGIVRGSISSAPRLSQMMLLNAYQQDGFEDEKQTKYELLRRRYHTLQDCFDRTAGFADRFERLPSNAGYFMCVRPLEVGAEELRLHVLKKYDVGVISTSGLIRIAFSSTPRHLLPILVESLVNAYDDLRDSER